MVHDCQSMICWQSKLEAHERAGQWKKLEYRRKRYEKITNDIHFFIDQCCAFTCGKSADVVLREFSNFKTEFVKGRHGAGLNSKDLTMASALASEHVMGDSALAMLTLPEPMQILLMCILSCIVCMS